MLLDDEVWPERLRRRVEAARSTKRLEWPRFVIVPVTALIVLLSIVRTSISRARHHLAGVARRAPPARAPFGIVNGYGLFAVMTTTRPEIVRRGQRRRRELEGVPVSLEGRRPLSRAGLRRAASAAARLADVVRRSRAFPPEPVVPRLRPPPARRLAAGHGPARRQPLPDAPPRYHRATLYDYTFTDLAERRATGHWWRRETKGAYLPAVSLESFR